MAKKLTALTILMILALILFSGNDHAWATDEIPVGVFGTLTGKDSDVNGMSYGTRDYFEYINGKFGGIMGHRIKCTLLDGHNITPIEVKHFRTLAGKEKAVMINGWGTGGTIALRELINETVKL